VTAAGPTILALETDSAWVVILAVSFVTLVVVGLLRRMIGRPGGVASGALLTLPLLLPLVAALVYQQAVLPEISVLQPAGSALANSSGNLLHLLLVADDRGKEFTLYALSGSAGPWVLLFAGLFSSFMLLRRGLGKLVLHRLVKRSSPLDPIAFPQAAVALERLSARARLKRTPELLLLPPGSLGAFATGGRRPKVLLCEELMAELEPCEIEAVIAHEIAHIGAHDVRLVASAGFLRDLVAWNPFAHLAYRHLARNREFEADRRAAELTSNPLAVASGLVKMCELMKAGSFGRRAALAFFRPGGRIKRRISALIELSDGGTAALRSSGYLPYALAGLLAIGLGLHVGARLATSEGSALAIMFGSPDSSSVEHWSARPELDVKKGGQVTKRGKIVHDKAAGLRSKPEALTPFSQPVSLRMSELAPWKKLTREIARREGGAASTVLLSDLNDYEAVPVVGGSVGLYRIREIQ
jgi:Zn-dependent protease with chaperone function